MKYGIKCIANDGVDRSSMDNWNQTARGWEAWCSGFIDNKNCIHIFDNINDAFHYRQKSFPNYGKVVYLIEEYNQ